MFNLVSKILFMLNHFLNISGVRFYLEFNNNTLALSKDIFSTSDLPMIGKEMMKKVMKMINCKYTMLVSCKGLKWNVCPRY